MPFRYNLKGEIANTSSGVAIHIQGPQTQIESFSKDLVQKCPPLARITEIALYVEYFKDFKDFTIADSRNQALMSTLIAPDVAVCDDCRQELLDPNDRRFKYPFINGTNCGPRYTIIDDIPYDRPKTSMKHFAMCAACQAEYDDPANRRFHAQPNACETCGPHLDLYDNTRKKVPTPEPLETTAALLKQGCIIAVKGLGGFHLAVDAQNDQAVEALRKRKLREEKPMALMSYDIESIRKFAHIEPGEEDLLSTRFAGPVIGLAFDGTGFGSDGNIWGGEILIAESETFSRAAHFAYVPMPGSSSAIKEPWRMAVSYLYDAFIAVSGNDDVIVTSFGDLMRVPGTDSSLLLERAKGRDIRIVYSTFDALEIAGKNPHALPLTDWIMSITHI